MRALYVEEMSLSNRKRKSYVVQLWYLCYGKERCISAEDESLVLAQIKATERAKAFGVAISDDEYENLEKRDFFTGKVLT